MSANATSPISASGSGSAAAPSSVAFPWKWQRRCCYNGRLWVIVTDG